MKKTKKKIRLSGVIFMLLTIYLFVMLLYYFITLPVKSINIKGNSLLTDSQIISESKIDYNNSIRPHYNNTHLPSDIFLSISHDLAMHVGFRQTSLHSVMNYVP